MSLIRKVMRRLAGGGSPSFPQDLEENPQGWGPAPELRGNTPGSGQSRDPFENPAVNDTFEQSQAKALSPTMGGYGIGSLAADTIDKASDPLGPDWSGMAQNIPPMLGIFAGPGARTADLGMLARAKDMIANGTHPHDVWRETGWGQGPSGDWHHEIDDSKQALSEQYLPVKNDWTRDQVIAHWNGMAPEQAGPQRLPEKLYHDDLYDAYPGIERDYVGITPAGDLGANFQPNYKHPQSGDVMNYHEVAAPLGPSLKRQMPGIVPRMRGDIPMDDWSERAKWLLTHELQHNVQKREGMPGGGNKVMFGPDSPLETHLDPGEDAFGGYYRLAGEVQARNAARRRNMSAEERRQVPPDLTEDVPRNRQIAVDEATEAALKKWWQRKGQYLPPHADGGPAPEQVTELRGRGPGESRDPYADAYSGFAGQLEPSIANGIFLGTDIGLPAAAYESGHAASEAIGDPELSPVGRASKALSALLGFLPLHGMARDLRQEGAPIVNPEQVREDTPAAQVRDEMKENATDFGRILIDQSSDKEHGRMPPKVIDMLRRARADTPLLGAPIEARARGGRAAGGPPPYPGDEPVDAGDARSATLEADAPEKTLADYPGLANFKAFQPDDGSLRGTGPGESRDPYANPAVNDTFEQQQAQALSPAMSGYGLGQGLGKTINAVRSGDYNEAAKYAIPLAASMLPLPGLGHNMPPEGEMAGRAEIEPREGLNEETGHYSVLTAAARDAQMKAGTPAQWTNHFKKQGVKDEEMKWTGMVDFLKGLPPNQKVPKTDVLAHAQKNEVMPSSHTLDEETGEANSEQAYEAALDEAYGRYAARPSTRWIEYYKDEEAGRYAVEQADNDPGLFQEGQDGTPKWRVANTDDPGQYLYGDDKLFDSKEEAQRALDDYIRDLDPVSDFGEDEIPWEIYDPHSGSVYDTIEPRHSNRSSHGGYRATMQDRADEWISEAASNDASENSNDAAREAPSLGYMNERPGGGDNYADIVLGMDRDVLKRRGVKQGIGAHFFDEEANNVPPDVPGWGLTEEYHDRATNQKGLGVHEQQSDWQQKGQDQGFAGAASPEEIEEARVANGAAEKQATAASALVPVEYNGAHYDLSGADAGARHNLRRATGELEYNTERAQSYKQSYDAVADEAARYEAMIKAEGPNPTTPKLPEHLEDAKHRMDTFARRMAEYQQQADGSKATIEATINNAPQVPPERAVALKQAADQAELRRQEAYAKLTGLTHGIAPGPWVTDQAATHRLISSRMMHEAAKRGLDWVGVSSPDLVAARWGQRGYTQPLYGKTLPNIYRALAREHDPKAELERFYPGSRQSVVGKYDISHYGKNPLKEGEPYQSDLPFEAPFNFGPSGQPAPVGSFSQRPANVAMGPASSGNRYATPKRDDTPAYYLTDESGRPLHDHEPSSPSFRGPFKTREAAEEAMRQVNEGLDKGFRAPTPEELQDDAYMTGVRLTPQMRESILKRGFKSFRRGGEVHASMMGQAKEVLRRAFGGNTLDRPYYQPDHVLPPPGISAEDNDDFMRDYALQKGKDNPPQPDPTIPPGELIYPQRSRR